LHGDIASEEVSTLRRQSNTQVGISIVAIKLAAFFEFVELEVPFPASNKMLLSRLFIYCFITRPPCNQYSEQI